MKLAELSKEEIQELSMVEVAYLVMKETKEPFNYQDLLKKVAELKGMSEEQMLDRIGYLYTDLNIDGRFVTLGDNRWGLRSWYPLEQVEEEITGPTKKKAKAKAEEEVDELDENIEVFDDEFEDLEDELDELAESEDSDEEDEEFDEGDDIDELDDEFEESDDDL
ncbi:DNA-directed RNA polymerase subunit delta [Halalkalibacterium halodurans]|uniref:Probable DNA-directed RNA polymerase subunit delta n=1 Tax=Halalkalibacterium halodurans (strain ATCC BAA-125 / DSM 18197 / FERM 7344 / JCM 9153 / C-125) TaxID=272558 RepID=RPOE_HALH5|nr:DNA-directed RNA polymerase subunit delta [Halalkalibacterium halodurans]Q9K6D6.1 RecName: Full=Probable DNA-directed RNA polymerase subunit delta; AltName: Full=RNAP delta factor [Halalkalibacterium halodurans C-125]MDY7224298.1 DNA-directed RNA polymerase subunit delta [Halalkalibacterium halodurans]MDY7243583.1 DNA-directed RNA polymerase subunit delta [Halalkalibacterium halodurans]MED4079503.1 DNA-directed RNA polymerase subunit delta [Halalkalibacterium halodurans]MED4084220.1 DNA-dir